MLTILWTIFQIIIFIGMVLLVIFELFRLIVTIKEFIEDWRN